MIKKSREGEVEKELRNAIDLCKALSGRSHLCLVGSGDAASDALDVQPLALRLTKVSTGHDMSCVINIAH